MDLPKRKRRRGRDRLDRVGAVGRTEAAGEQWKLTLVSSRTPAGSGTPLSTTWRYTPSRPV